MAFAITCFFSYGGVFNDMMTNYDARAADGASTVTFLAVSLEYCIMMFIDFYIARSTYCFIFMYTCGLTVVIKRIIMLCYDMLLPVTLRSPSASLRWL